MDISIIVPVYNVEKYLNCCIDSLLNQNFKGEYEIICVNDGSTDGSLQILQSYKEISKKVVIIDQKNKGLSGARNTGLKKAKGKYVMFLDSDDYLKHSEVLSLMYNEIEKNDLDFVIADFEYDYEDKKKNYRKQRDGSIKNKIMNGKDFYDLGIKTKSIMSVVWNKLYKRKFLIENNLYFVEGIIYEDMEFTPKVYYLADKVKYIDEVIIMYRQREGSIMNNNNINKLNDYFVIADSLREFNKKFNSKTLLNSELYIYVTVIRKLKYIEDKKTKDMYKLKLKERSVVSKLMMSNKLKYKLFGIMHFLKLT